MLKRTRIGRSLDSSRLGEALSRPGLDTRCWVSLAFALDESQVDQGHGVFVNVRLHPSEEEYTARIPSDYAGNGFGFYAKIHKDDALVVIIPSGDASEGVIVSDRLWSAADLPPTEAVNAPDEVMLVIEKDKTLRIATSGAGKVILNSADIRLGDDDPSDHVAVAEKVNDDFSTIKTFMDGLVNVLNTPVNEPGNGAPSAFQAAIGIYLATQAPDYYPAADDVSAETTKVK